MARENIDIGIQGNDGTGDSIRESFRKVNDNFRQLFAIFGEGDRIAFTDLDDTPNTYSADQVIVADSEGVNLVAKNLVGGEGISVDHSDENEIRIISTGGRVSNDIRPSLGNHLNAQQFIIGNYGTPDEEAAARFNDVHNTSITVDDLLIPKGYADQRYLQVGGNGEGAKIRIRQEPEDASEYTIIIQGWVNGFVSIPDHGFNTGQNGAAFRYFAEIAPASGLISGSTYYFSYHTKDLLSVHSTREDAIENINRIVVNDPIIEPRGLETLVDFYYDVNLPGNWLRNEALPRESIVRRQGDVMEGPLRLYDHPGTLAGAGTPNGPDDLQAATKLYVDSSSFASSTNLFVAMSGDDLQTNTPPGKEGRALAYAYATVGAACLKAEELVSQSLSEPGPYRQVMTYANYSNPTYLNTYETNSGARRTLRVFTNGSGIDQSKDVDNRDLREGSIIKGLRSGATARVINYNGIVSLDDVYIVELLHKETDITNFQSDYKFASDKLLLNRDFIRAEVVAYIRAKYPNLNFDNAKCSRDVGLIVDALAFDIKFGGNNKSIRAAKSYWNGAVNVLPVNERAPTVDGINYIDLLAQQIITNTVILPAVGDTGFGKRTTTPQQISGAAGEAGSSNLIFRLVTSIKNIVANGLTGDGTLLEFLLNEPLEFGQPVSESQITIFVESGIYYEQLPIRVPVNVSIKGDEFRRSLIRPAPGVSTSPWANIYFYRDEEFDGLTRTFTTQSNAAISSGNVVTLTTGTITGLETGMYLSVTSGTGSFAPATTVTRLLTSTSFEVSQTPLTALSGATVRGLNGSGLAPVGSKFGYHYLTDPTGVSGIFSSSPAPGNIEAASLLQNNRTLIRDEVIRYINAKYPTLDYNETLCSRDVGYIVDALVYDLTNGGYSRSLAAGQAYRRNSSGLKAISVQLTETVDGIDYINLLAQYIIDSTPLPAAVGTGFGKRGSITQATGNAPEEGADGFIEVLVNGIKNTIIGTNNPPKANKDMDVFLLNDGTILRNITVQGHGGFMCVLDPEGQIETRSPYFQTATSLSGSTNKKRFAGGMLIDGFNGNLPARIVNKDSNFQLRLDDLTVRKPGIPTAFYIQGQRFQINAIEEYDRSSGTCIAILDESTPYTANTTSPLSIIIETPGNRSMLCNDFTQVNDLGYGIVATNNGLCEAVSMFTYYNQISYFANNGAQIRSVTGSSCNGVFGLKAAGRDPNEIPDPVTLADNTLQTCRVFKRDTFASKNVSGEQSIYIDHYQFVPYNVSEIEIDPSPTRSRIVENTDTFPNNITIVNPGSGYTVGDFIEVNGGTLFPGGVKTRFRVTNTGVGGSVTGFELIEAGDYFVNPVGGFPTVKGIVSTTAETPSTGTNASFQATYLGDITVYEVANIERTTTIGTVLDGSGTPTNGFVLKLNLSAAAGELAGLRSPLVDGQIITIRGLQNFRFSDVEKVRPVRPSTALEFTDSTQRGSIYRTLAYGLNLPTGESLPSNQAILTFDTSFEYSIVQVKGDKVQNIDYIEGGSKTMGSQAGDTRIAVETVTSPKSIDKLNSGSLIFPWAGKLHIIDAYFPPQGGNAAYIVISDKPLGQGTIVSTSTGLAQGFTETRNTNIRGGLQIGAPAEITVNISTCRATGHDFLDVGSGGFNSTNYPNNLLGPPATEPDSENIVVEEGQGRVFHVSTDQDGIFRVGRFFTVDQGTGTVTFAASIALSNLDGIGFKRGTVVREFSTDDTMTDNDENSVPVESAVRGYIDRRLGKTHNGGTVPLDQRIPALTGGFLPVFGNPTLEDNLSMGSTVGHRITNLLTNSNSSTDAANVGFVDGRIETVDSWYKLKEVLLMSPEKHDIPVFIGDGRTVISSTPTGDISFNLTSTNTSLLTNAITGTSQSDVSAGIVISNITGFPSSGFIQINNEIFSYTSITGASNRFNGVTRAVAGTTATTHSAGSAVLGLDNSRLDLQIQSGAITNTDINDSAAIAQSKLSLNAATTRDNATGITQADRGLASFDSANFEITNGWVGIKTGGVSLSEIQNIASGRILGNLTGSAAAPQEITTDNLVGNGINTLFANIDAGANVMTRRFNSLRSTSTYSSITGTPIAGSGTFTNVPANTVSGTGNGARFTIGYNAGSYSGIQATYGGNRYSEGDQLIIPGTLLGGTSPANDLQFTVAITGSNIDTQVYFGIERVSSTAEASSIVKTDASRNLGSSSNRFNNIHSVTFTGTATQSNNLNGGVLGSVPYQSASNSTTFLNPGTAGLYLRTNGSGLAPSWEAVPNGGADTLSGTTLASNIVNSSLTNFGNLVNFGVENNIIATGTDLATARALTHNINIVTSVPLNTGVRMPVAVAGTRIIIRNGSASTLKIYPTAGSSFFEGVQGEEITMEPNATFEYFCGASEVGGTGGRWYKIDAAFA
jgi:hypothetical protein